MMNKENTIKMIALINFLSEYAMNVTSYGETEITFEMNDVNEKIDGEPWENYVKDIFKGDNISFSYGKGNWTTIEFKF